MKKTLLFLICAALACACLVSASAEGGASGIPCAVYAIGGETYPDPLWEYEILPDGTARITGYLALMRDVTLPESVDGIPVSALGAGALPDTVWQDFTVTIPDCVTAIAPDAFGNIHCRIKFRVSDTHPTLKLMDGVLVSVPENRIIRGTPRGDLVIPEGIETIDSYAFWGSSVTSVSIPASVTTLGRNPFAFCNTNRDNSTLLQDVSVSPYNAALFIRDGILFSREDRRLVWCFDHAYRLDPVYVIPEGTEIIDDFAFMRWGLLTSVTIPASVTTLGANPFIGLQEDDVVRLDEGNTALALAGHLLLSRADRRVVSCLARFVREPLTVPAGTEVIGDYAFYTVNSYDDPRGNAVDVVIPDSVTTVGAGAFWYAYSLRPVLPAGIRTVGSGAFYRCLGLDGLPVFTGYVEIGEYAFCDCFRISALEIRAGARIGGCAFSGCSEIMEIRIGGNNTRIGAGAFSTCRNVRRVDFGEGVTTVGESAFRNDPCLEEISLPASLSWIAEGALMNDSDMEYSPVFDSYITIYKSTARVLVPAGSYAERYCRDNGIETVGN